jgi:ATP-binding cassette subfamily B protein
VGIFKKLGWYFKQEQKRYIFGVVALIGTALVNLIPPRVIGILADIFDQGHVHGTAVWWWIGILVTAGILQYIFRYGWRNMIWGGAAKLEKQLRSRLFWHFMEMDDTFFQRHRTGDLMAHATNDLNAIQNVAGAGILTFADSIITGGSTLVAMMIFVDWRLTLVAIIPMPLLAVAARRLGMKLHAAFSESQAAFSRLNDKTQESVSGIKVIKTFGQDAEDLDDFNHIVDRTIGINKRVNRIDSMFDPVISIIIGATYVIAIIYGGTLVNAGTITIGALISFVAYVNALVWPMFAIGRLFNVIERGNASYDRVQSLLQEKSRVVEVPHALTTVPHSDIQYDLQSFTYPGADKVTLQNIQFNLPEGHLLGITGRVGAGKTTIIKLLLREFDHYDGVIQIGGHDIRQYTLAALRNSIGYVPQDNFLFSTDIRNNIRFSAYDKQQPAVEAAAKTSAIHDDILQFAEQYDTLVGEKGVSLSGGQKQRLAIARAVIAQPDILILDDALSAVDAKTEEQILDGLKEDRAGKTTIIVAQRLSSVMHADEILVLDGGQITERGNHDALLAENGWYAKMWDEQQLMQSLSERSDD